MVGPIPDMSGEGGVASFVNSARYNADIDHLKGAVPVSCGCCEWTGTYAETKEVGDCSLTPGDASPAGRCPSCDSLCYPARRVDEERAFADEAFRLLRNMHARLETLGFGKPDAAVSGADLVDVMGAFFVKISAALDLVEEDV